MDVSAQRPQTNRRQLQQIIAGLSEGVILIEPDQTIRWANQAALDMHGVSTIAELGQTVSEYRERSSCATVITTRSRKEIITLTGW